MEQTTATKQQSGRLKAFFKRIQQLAWLELFEKWFGFGVRLLWIVLLLIFGFYLRKEYKKDIFYIQDFQVPPVWTEQGYSGAVVKQAIIDEIDKITNSVYLNEKSIAGVNQDGTELLSDFSIEGFNLKAITKSIMAILGKKNKYISGYVTISDSTQTVAIQVTDQITQPLSVKRNEPAQKLIHKATLEIMKVKSPVALISYYMTRQDTSMVLNVYKYLARHRELLKDYLFYDISTSIAMFERNYDRAFAWADSTKEKFPNDKSAFFGRAKIYAMLIYYDKKDSVNLKNYKKLFVENLRKAKEPGRTTEMDSNIDKLVDQYLAAYYLNEEDYPSFIKLVEKSAVKNSLDPAQQNALAYGYMYQKEYKKAEETLRKVLFVADHVGDYWDSLAELYSMQRQDSLAVVTLAKALKSPQKTSAVSVEAYQKDARWERLRKRADFQKLLKGV